MKKNYKISCLVDYLKILEKLNIDEYILRGQTEPFFDISASAFRIYKGSFSSSQIYDYPNLLKAYYNTICTKLTLEEKENFIAFSQHHSLPTNLVDFTNSPLIALFFSCFKKKELSFTIEDLINDSDKNSIIELTNSKTNQDMLISNLIDALKKNDYKGKNSVIYLIKKDKTIDITDILKQENCFDFYDRILVDEKVQNAFYDRLSMYFKENQSRIRSNILNILKVVIDNGYSCYYKDSDGYFRKAFNKYKKNFFSLHDLYIDLIENLDYENTSYGLMTLNSSLDENKIAAKVYLGLLIQLLEIVKNYNGYTSSGVATLDLELYFTYSPPLMFDRIKNQNGIFIYQPFLFLLDSTYNYNVLVKQSIKPDITIEVENYSKMLQELDRISINSSFVFSDYDNIAMSLKNKFILE